MAMNESMKDLRKLSKVLCLQSPYYVLLYYLSLSKKRLTGLIASFTEMNLNQSFWQDSKQDPKGQFHSKTAQSVQRRWVKVFNIQLMVHI